MHQDLLDIVSYAAETARSSWEGPWMLWKAIAGYPDLDAPPATDACIPTAFALRDVLWKMIPEYSWKAVGGRPTKRTPAGGFRDRTGVSHPHLWVEGRRTGDLVIVDITADQFGAPPIIVHEGLSPIHTANNTPRLLKRFAEHEAPTIEFLVTIFDQKMRAISSERTIFSAS